MEYVIEIENLCKSYDDFSLKNINLAVPKGAVTGFIGENGAGKTTIIKLILNMIKSDGGKIDIFGMDNKENEVKIKEKIGVVLNEYEPFNSLKIKQINKMMKNIYDDWNEDIFYKYLDEYKINKNKVINEFSTGMKQKLFICIALSHNPDLLILDEPTNGLDPIVRNEILESFLDFIQNEEKSVFISSHITSDLEKICDYIAYIKNGEIVLFEEKDKLLEEYALAKGEKEELKNIDESYIVGVRESKYSYTILIKNKEKFISEYPNIITDKITLEDIMVFNKK